MISVKPHNDGYIVKIDAPDEDLLFEFVALLMHISSDDDYDRVFTKALKLLRDGQVTAAYTVINDDEDDEEVLRS